MAAARRWLKPMLMKRWWRCERSAAEMGCRFSIDTDAHAPGQLDWLENGCVRAEKYGIAPDRVINTRTAGELTASTP